MYCNSIYIKFKKQAKKLVFEDACLCGRPINKRKKVIFIKVRTVCTFIGGGSDWEKQEGTR